MKRLARRHSHAFLKEERTLCASRAPDVRFPDKTPRSTDAEADGRNPSVACCPRGIRDGRASLDSIAILGWIALSLHSFDDHRACHGQVMAVQLQQFALARKVWQVHLPLSVVYPASLFFSHCHHVGLHGEGVISASNLDWGAWREGATSHDSSYLALLGRRESNLKGWFCVLLDSICGAGSIGRLCTSHF